MRIVRPYGSSATERGAHDHQRLRRVLRREVERGQVQVEDIEVFAGSHDALVIAQWVSAIDKIAAKPSGSEKPSPDQRTLRRRLGEAAWAHLVTDGLLPGLADDPTLKTRWWMRMEPYPEGDEKKKKRRVHGRWYRRFAGAVEPTDVDAGELVARIAAHLHEGELPLHPERPARRTGRIARRAASIAANTATLDGCGREAEPDAAWEAGWTTYVAAGDVAAQIHAEARKVERAPRDAKTGRRQPPVRLDLAAKVLFDHWARVFKDGEQGTVLSVGEVKARSTTDPELAVLFAIHQEVREVYRRLLKRTAKAAKPGGVARQLPASAKALRELMKRQRQNRDVAALVRLGKVIHYEAAGDGGDTPERIIEHWPDRDRLAASRFWTSDGQAEIKANEAFVRVWRRVLALMHRTATDWAAPDTECDIVLKGGRERAVGDGFCAERYRRKLKLLFGERARWFTDGTDAAPRDRAILRFALEGLAALRNNAFHFKGSGGFRTALTTGLSAGDEDVRAAAVDLWSEDVRGRGDRLATDLEGAQVPAYLDKATVERLVQALSSNDDAAALLPLPRFNRVLARAQNIRAKGVPRLPDAPSRQALEKEPARRAQYTALKLVYERPFRQWLDKLERREGLNVYIRRSVDRSTEAARKINDPRDKEKRQLILARAARLGGLDAGQTMAHLVEKLTGETASEMRVQRGYQSDGENAREQAAYIDELLCDVVARAFDDYLGAADLRALLRIAPEPTVAPADRADPRAFLKPASVAAPEPWQATLYFLLHLAPVDDVAALLHQLRKFVILVSKHEQKTTARDTKHVIRVLQLYLDMHDAKFEGGHALDGLDAFAGLFESEEVFKQAVAKPVCDGETARVPTRGLREIARFGHLRPLLPIFETQKVSAADVEELATRDTTIAEHQEKRENLHAEWVKSNKGKCAKDDAKDYVEALCHVVVHRRLANHVTLTTHVRLHRLLMAVLGRLLDFAGLYERDLYFASLALIHHAGLTPQGAYNREGRKGLRRGQIVWATDNLDVPEINADLERLFRTSDVRKTRNDFAHFNLLKPSRWPVNLTDAVEACRGLMRYDRKLTNAVTAAVRELAVREGLELTWQLDHAQGLHGAELESRAAQHLNKGKRSKPILEALHADAFVEMAARLFGGEAKQADWDVVHHPMAPARV